jgi:ABC-type amino acid transport substrate-binding protein
MQRHTALNDRASACRWAIAAIIAIAGPAIFKPAHCPAGEKRSTRAKIPLIVCAVPDALPHTARAEDGTAEGLDIAVVELLAKELNRRVEFHWCANASCSWNCLCDRRCDVIVGQPHEFRLASEVAWSIPYSGSRLGLVIHRDAKPLRSAADLVGKRVGIVTGSVRNRLQGQTVSFKTRDELMEHLARGQVDAALVEDNFAAWYLHWHPDLPLQRAAEYAPPERWNMGLAVRAEDKRLLADFNRVLSNAMESGKLNRLYAEQGVAYRAPSSTDQKKLVSANSWQRILERGELVVSFDPANLPYSSERDGGSGFDFELAQALAGALGVKLRVDWIDVQRETAIGKLLDGQCDLAFGAAIEPRAVDDEMELAAKVLYSKPYYGTGYVLLTRKAGPRATSLADVKGEKSRRLGTEAGSVADYRLRQRGYLRRLFRTQLSVLKSLNDGGIDYAYLWANVGWTLHNTPEFDLVVVADRPPEDYWNIAVAMRRGDDDLKLHVDDLIDKLVDEGVVSQAVSRYHVPYFPPFQIVGDSPAPITAARRSPELNGTIRRQPTDRGVEPQSERAQRSKRPYRALDRIRSAGVLVVGMDQNCLPFSTAHPAPAGLDYDIARRLADKLGVSLSVFWAYSSHDSYPAKLAYKRLCDVMLGVMPDDRFGAQVAFSKPYYFAEYRFVVPAGGPGAGEHDAVAVERGAALRGLRGRPIREYPSLERILRAVVDREERAAYVISTQGQWLAEERWPDQLRFVRGESEPVDRFPICAAVRKSDGDLREAVDQVLDQLAQSGELADIFKRWHVPYDWPRTAKTQ